MRSGRFVSYFRVSTGKQGRSGLGLEAQQQTVRERLNGGDWTIVGTFTEIETGTAKKARPELQRALAMCRVMNATLIVANVSRLTRDPDFMATLVAAGVEAEFCDLPNTDGPVGRFVLRQMLAVAELEAGMIADRTRKALAAAKARGVVLGGDRGNLPAVSARGRVAGLVVRQAKASQRAADLAGILADIRNEGAESLQQIADALNAKGIQAARGGEWKPVQVKRVLDKVA